MPRFIEIDESKLVALHDGLDLLEMLDRDAMSELDLYVYGITTNEGVVDAAREAIADSRDVTEQDVQLTEVAVAIRLGADTIYALHGSGIRLDNEDFAYMGEGGEGIRTLAFTFSRFKPTATLGYFNTLALAMSDAWLDDFLRKHGSAAPAKVTPAVHRTEEATQPGVPPAPGVPKQTSVHGAAKLSDLIENFLR